MKQIYMKETRNEDGKFYRKGDWASTVPDAFGDPTAFTKVQTEHDYFWSLDGIRPVMLPQYGLKDDGGTLVVKRDNWTTVQPPQETLEHGVPCDWDGTQWVLDTASPEYKEYQKKLALTTMHDTLSQGVEYNGVVYQCALEDIQRLNSTMTQIDLGSLTEVDVRAMDNTMHTLTDGEFQGLLQKASEAYYNALKTYWSTIDS